MEKSEDVKRRLRPWVEALGVELGVDGQMVQRMASWSDDVQRLEGQDIFMGAAEIAEKVSKSCGEKEGVFAALYYLKSKGRESGRSPAGHWRIHRLLNAGSRAVDVVLECAEYRRLALQSLLFRIANSAMCRAQWSEGAMRAEVIYGVGWNDENGEVVKKGLPSGAWKQKQGRKRVSDVELGEESIDWLLGELVCRGLSSVTMGSIIEDHAGGRRYVLSEEVQRRKKELPVNEGSFLAGAVFAPAILGGARRSIEERLLDAMAVASEIEEGFVAEPDRFDAYAEHLGWVQGKRAIAVDLLQTQVVGGIGGRWGLKVHPLRLGTKREEGIFALEAGFYPEGEGRRNRQTMKELQRLADEEDGRIGTEFFGMLDEVIDAINIRPGAVSGCAGVVEGGAPLWDGLREGVEELCRIVRNEDLEALGAALQRWSFGITHSMSSQSKGEENE